jgi:hypothetical protein
VGTYADQAALAVNNEFIAKVRVALIKKALDIFAGADRQSVGTLNLVTAILSDSDGYAARMAWLIAAGNSEVGTNAPAIPDDGALSWCVADMLPKLVR